MLVVGSVDIHGLTMQDEPLIVPLMEVALGELIKDKPSGDRRGLSSGPSVPSSPKMGCVSSIVAHTRSECPPLTINDRDQRLHKSADET